MIDQDCERSIGGHAVEFEKHKGPLEIWWRYNPGLMRSDGEAIQIDPFICVVVLCHLLFVVGRLLVVVQVISTAAIMSQQYIVTAKSATSVSKSLVCHFTGTDDLNLVIAKGARLEIREITPEGLQHRLDVPIYGAIATMEAYRLQDESCDRLFVLTERYQYCVIHFDAEKQVRYDLTLLSSSLARSPGHETAA